MKRKRFSVGQIVAIVKQAEMGLPVAELIRRVCTRDTDFHPFPFLELVAIPCSPSPRTH